MASSVAHRFSALYSVAPAASVSCPDWPGENDVTAAEYQLSMASVDVAATLLRQHLGLTLFGFDVILDKQTGGISITAWCPPVSGILVLGRLLFLCVEAWSCCFTLTAASCASWHHFVQLCHAVQRLRMCRQTPTLVLPLAGTHYIVDVNYFPSYKSVDSAPALLSQALADAQSEHTSGG